MYSFIHLYHFQSAGAADQINQNQLPPPIQHQSVETASVLGVIQHFQYKCRNYFVIFDIFFFIANAFIFHFCYYRAKKMIGQMKKWYAFLYILLGITIICLSRMLRIFIKRSLQSRFFDIIARKPPIQIIKARKLKSFEMFKKKYQEQLYVDNKSLEKYFIYLKIMTKCVEDKTNQVMFFYGQPGVGKTELARDICQYNGGGYLIKISEMLFLGDKAGDFLLQIFNRAEQENKILIFDDGDLGFLNRNKLQKIQSNNAQQKKQIIALMITILSILGNKGSRLKVIITSNLYSNNTDCFNSPSADPAINRRVNIFEFFALPNVSQRKMIWLNRLKKSNMDITNKDKFFDFISQISEGLSGRDITHLSNSIKTISKNNLNKIISSDLLIEMINIYIIKNITTNNNKLLEQHEKCVQTLFSQYNENT